MTKIIKRKFRQAIAQHQVGKAFAYKKLTFIILFPMGIILFAVFGIESIMENSPLPRVKLAAVFLGFVIPVLSTYYDLILFKNQVKIHALRRECLRQKKCVSEMIEIQ